MARIWQYLHPAYADNITAHRYDPFIHPDQSRFTCDFAIQPPGANQYLKVRRTAEVVSRYASGRPKKIVGSFYLQTFPDCSAFKEQLFRPSNRIYFIKIDLEGRYTHANPYFLKTFDFKLSELLGQDSMLHILAEDHSVCQQAVLQSISNPGERIPVSFRKPRPDGQYFWTEWEFVTNLDDQGVPQEIECYGFDITKSKTLEQELAQTQNSIATIFATMEEVVWSVRLPEYETIYTSPSVAELYGIPLEVFLADSRLWERQIHPADKEVIQKIYQAVNGGGSYNVDYRIITPDQTIKWVNNHAKVVKDEAGNPIRLDGVLKDITDRKNAEQLVKNQQLQMENLFESMEEVVWSRRVADRQFTFVSPSVTKIFGISQEAFMVDPDQWKKMAHPEDQEVVERIRALARSQGAFDEEYRIVLKDGTIKWVSHTGRLVYDEQGLPDSLNGLFKDITSKKEAEQALRRSEEKFRNLFEFSVVGKIKLDFQTGNILEANPAILQLLGYSEDELLQRSIYDISPPQYQEVDENTRERLLNEGQSIGIQKHYRRQDGTLIPVLVSAFMIEEEGRQIVWSNVQDYQDVYQKNKELAESEERLKLALDGSLAATWDTDLINEVAHYDHRWANMLGYDIEKVSAVPFSFWTSIIHPEEKDRVIAAANNHVLGKSNSYETEYRLRHKAGYYIWVKERGKVVSWTPDGQPARMVGMLFDDTNTKKFIEQLEQKEADLRETQRTARIGSWLYNTQTGKYELSQIACEIFELPIGAALEYEALLALFHPEDIQYFINGDFDQETGFEHRITIQEKTKWIFVKSKPLDQKRGPYSHKGIVQDITDQKNAEESLRDQELRFRTFIENASDLICTVSLRGDIEFISPNVYQMTGFQAEEAVGHKLIEFLHPDDLPIFLEAMSGILEKNFGIAEYRLSHKDGSWIWVQTTIKVIVPRKGYPYALCYARDITEQKKRQQLIERLSLVASKSTNAIVICDQQARIEWVNDGFVRQTGYEVQEVVGRKPGDFLQGPATAAEDILKIREGLASGKPFSQTILNYHKNGSTYWLDINMSPLYNEGGELTGYIAVETDITNRKIRERELKRMLELTQVQNRRLQNFTYIVSHNIRSHAANFQGLLEMLNMDLEPQERKQYEEMMDVTSKNLLETISILNEVVSIHQATQLPKETIQVRDRIKACWEKTKEGSSPTQATIHLDIAPNFSLYFPLEYFDFMLEELIKNAFRYQNPQHPLVLNIVSKHDHEYDILEITDNGLGINVDRHKDRLFGLFQIFHEHPEARGIGLFMVKNRLESCGGKVEVRSKEGKGTTIVLKFLNETHAAIFENMGG